VEVLVLLSLKIDGWCFDSEHQTGAPSGAAVVQRCVITDRCHSN